MFHNLYDFSLPQRLRSRAICTDNRNMIVATVGMLTVLIGPHSRF